MILPGLEKVVKRKTNDLLGGWGADGQAPRPKAGVQWAPTEGYGFFWNRGR